MTVDAEFEVKTVGPGGRGPDAADRVAVLDARTFLDGNLEQIPIQAEGPRSVIQNDEVSESGKSARKCNDAVVDGEGVRAFGR